ncbi:MAG: hypothetical protein Q9201_001781 [Fulgogasparrea decipioides]
MVLKEITSAFCLVAFVLAHDEHRAQKPMEGPHQGKSIELQYAPSKSLNSILGQADSVFSGISTFGRLPYFPCLVSDEEKYDIAFIGTYVLPLRSFTYDPQNDKGSRKVRFSGGYNVPLDANPFDSWAKVLDCGDIPVTSFDNVYAIQQIEQGHNMILTRSPFTDSEKTGPSKTGKTLPRVITLGGDHTITLPLLRSVVAAYGPISVIHFDSHLSVAPSPSSLPFLPKNRGANNHSPSDTWRPKVFGGAPTSQAAVNHGTYFYHAHEEGLLANDTNIHAGIRTTLSGPSDYDNDGYCGFQIVEAREIDSIGTEGIIKKIRERVGTEKPVYLSIDIDTLDPAYAPATGTPETGGWSTRELRTIVRGLEGINFVAADIVEVAPAYDTNAELTTMAAADTLFEVMGLMVKRGPMGVMGGEEQED